MHIIRPDLQTLARACEHLLANAEELNLSEDEKHFVLYYAAELVNKFGKPINGHSHQTHQSVIRNALEPTQTEQSASPTARQTP